MESDSVEQKDTLTVELTADIVAAYVRNNALPAGELGALMADVHRAIEGLSGREPETVVVEKPNPAVPIKKSVQDDRVTCLECGLAFKSLKRHLGVAHDLTPSGYREKWNLPRDYPMVAPAYAETRSRLAKEMQLGKKGRMNKRPRR